MEPQQNKGQPQHNPHKCNTSRMPKYRSNRLQQPATNRYQRDMRSKRRDAGRKTLEPRQAQAQHKPPHCNMSRIPKCRPDRSQQPTINLYQRICDQQQKNAEEKKLEPQQAQGQAQRKQNQCNMSRIPKFRPNCAHQLATS